VTGGMQVMVTATVSMKNGDKQRLYADDFPQLFEQLAPYEDEIVCIRGKAILLKDMRQGKEKNNAQPV